MQADGFAWWIARMQRQFELFDMVRIDHFPRPGGGMDDRSRPTATAVDGFWQDPGDALLARRAFPDLPSSPKTSASSPKRSANCGEVPSPGMAVLQFAFDHFADNPHKPANIITRHDRYTGTHDNDTCVGWFSKLQAHERALRIPDPRH